MLGAEELFIMQKIKSLIVTKLEKKTESVVIITCLINSIEKKYEVIFASVGVNLPAELEFILRANDISISKNLLQILQNYKNCQQLAFPLFVSVNSQELKIA